MGEDAGEVLLRGDDSGEALPEHAWMVSPRDGGPISRECRNFGLYAEADRRPL
jgi:hypothetical protein